MSVSSVVADHYLVPRSADTRLESTTHPIQKIMMADSGLLLFVVLILKPTGSYVVESNGPSVEAGVIHYSL